MVAELATQLAQDMARRFPPAIANNPAQMVSQQRLRGIFELVFARAARFGQENEFGWYKRTRLGRWFRWELEEMGYDEKFVHTAAAALLRSVRRDPRASPETANQRPDI